MQTGRRFIQNVDGLSGSSSGKLCRQLDTLRLASGQLCGRLAQLDIGKSHFVQCVDLPCDGRNIFEELRSFLHGHIQNIKNALSFIFDIQCLSIITFSAANFARNIHIRKEMHLDLNNTVAAAGLASSAFYVETKTSLVVTFRFCIGCGCKQVADQVKYTGVRCRVGTRRSSDRRLVDGNDLVQLLHALDGIMFSCDGSGTVQLLRQCLVYDLVDQRTLTGSGYTCHTSHHAQRDFYVNIFQVVFPRTAHGQPTGRNAALLRNRDLSSAAEIISGDRVFTLHDLLCGTDRHNLSAVGTGSRSDIHDAVCRHHRIFIVFHHDHAVAKITKMKQCL